MPTVGEIVCSLVRHSDNAGCTWDGIYNHADCQTLPDKETPLWAPDWSSIYYWAANEYNSHEAYYVSYNGSIIGHQPKFHGETHDTATVLRENPSLLRGYGG